MHNKKINIKIICIFILYQIVQLGILPLFGIYLLIRKFKKKNGVGSLKERIGLIPKTKQSTPTIWLHAVSVGEILSIQNLIDQIKKQSPNASIYITTGTQTGKNIAQKNLTYNYLSFLPFDFLLPMMLAFKRIKPKAIIIVEAEIWPNFLMLANFYKIPTYLINARISERSKPKYQKLQFFFQPLFNIFKNILVQSTTDKKNFEELKIDSSKLNLLGNIKALNVFAKKETSTKILIEPNKYKILLVGSLHPGELDIYLTLFKELKTNISNLKLILAPRHFTWKEELLKKTEYSNYSYYIWGNETNLSPDEMASKILSNNDIILICKLGELFHLYQLCDLFFLGGTFVPVGGHNLLEPAVWGKPSIIGPYYQNCKDIADKLEKENALIKIKNEKDLTNQIEFLLKNPSELKYMGNKASFWLKTEASFVQKKLDILIKDLMIF